MRRFRFHPYCEPAGEKSGSGSADATAALVATLKGAMDEKFAEFRAEIEAKSRKPVTGHMDGVQDVNGPAVTETKDLSLDVDERDVLNARMGWRIMRGYYLSAALKGLAAPMEAGPERVSGEKEWAPKMRASLKKMEAAAKKGYLSLAVTKAGQNISTFADGGIWATETLSGELIAYLREESLMLSLPGLRKLGGYGTRIVFNRQKTAPSAQWVGEGQAATESKVTWDEVVLGAHKLAALTTISNDLIRLANGMAAAEAGDQLRIVMAEAVDLALINGSGSGKPNGVYTLTDSSHKVTVSAPDSTQNRVNDLDKLMKLVRKAFIPGARNGVYLMATDDFYILKAMRTTEGYVFPTLRDASPTLNGRPVLESTRLEGIGSSSKNILGYVVPEHLLFGEPRAMEFEVGENGNDFKNDECSVRGLGYADFGMKYRKAAAFYTDAKYT
jgi:HK97 family phage major capsid protein